MDYFPGDYFPAGLVFVEHFASMIIDLDIEGTDL